MFSDPFVVVSLFVIIAASLSAGLVVLFIKLVERPKK